MRAEEEPTEAVDTPRAGRTKAPDSGEAPITLPPPAAAPDVGWIGIGPLALADLVDQEALGELVVSFYKVFGVQIRILAADGMVLATSTPGAPQGAAAGESDDAQYRVQPIEYDRRVIGRILIGPYIPEDASEPSAVPRPGGKVPEFQGPAEILGMRRMTERQLDHATEHLRAVLDSILFSGHRALLTSTMHVASIRESYRELSEKNAELRAAYERLQELDRLKSSFLATVSHELRTPLTSIMGYSEMLAEGIGGPLNGEQREFVQTIRTKSDQLLGLIMSLLDLSKLESGTLALRRSDVTIQEVLLEAVSTIMPTATKKSVELRVSCEPDLPLLLGDGDRLRQVFINLLENAVKFTEPGGHVTLNARGIVEDPDDMPGLILVAPLRSEIEVRVADTGIGIPESQRAKVFDPFYQIDQSSTREHGGTGLGLSIVKRLIEAHRGSIRIEENHPRGAVFVVVLPTAGSGVAPASSIQIPTTRVLQ
ncbi:periplasmic sensor signal transduction histidine kinase [Chondromyces apiculatus DSM 436]|uniref:histidine kinase n=1 Tax=Chondromyces apiculatus DSM 436 TaxID=1192034 RepID=A0A017SXK1_9BACT|nr:periplasmic sensor signal transduction histidine kinase [Chondromyces apiculatus DSM 436]